MFSLFFAVVRQNLAKNSENINFRPIGIFHPVFFIRIFHPGMCIFYPRQYVVRQNLANNSENINFRPLGIFHPGMCIFHPRQYVVRQNLAKNSENINFRPLGIFSLRIFHPDFSPWHVYLSPSAICGRTKPCKKQ